MPLGLVPFNHQERRKPLTVSAFPLSVQTGILKSIALGGLLFCWKKDFVDKSIGYISRTCPYYLDGLSSFYLRYADSKASPIPRQQSQPLLRSVHELPKAHSVAKLLPNSFQESQPMRQLTVPSSFYSKNKVAGLLFELTPAAASDACESSVSEAGV